MQVLSPSQKLEQSFQDLRKIFFCLTANFRNSMGTKIAPSYASLFTSMGKLEIPVLKKKLYSG